MKYMKVTILVLLDYVLQFVDYYDNIITFNNVTILVLLDYVLQSENTDI